ncbi:MAG: metal ABC transporter permease [Flavobacteriales bacterium]|nr:metal ABC transporter permease [Flavobacteriales bacterium]
MNDFWIILEGSLVAVSCGLLGAYLILRKMAMVGDAISHAVLPGIVIAYLVAQSRSSILLLLGAALFGLLSTFLIEILAKKARIQSDASIGITFTWLFAIGVILVSLYSGNADIDQDCVLYGDIAFVPLDTLFLGERDLGPTPIWLQGFNLFLVIAMIRIGYRGFLITSFDPSFSSGLGIKTDTWHYVLMGAVSFTVVLSFNAVGAILVVAFLVVPPATAYLLSNQLQTMMIYTVIFGVLSALIGFYLATWWSASISGAMAVASGILFLGVLVYQKLLRKRKKFLAITN